MIKFENTEVFGWEAAIRGMRNPMNSWEKSDSNFGCSLAHGADCDTECIYGNIENCYKTNKLGLYIGPNDYDLMKRLRKAGTPDHRKYMRMINVTVDITAPLYWWKEFDTYKVGTVANSCSTMHKIAEKEFTLDDFSCEHLYDDSLKGEFFKDYLLDIIDGLNQARLLYLKTKDKKYWRVMIQLLPSSYNQRRTVQLNYEVLANIYKSRKHHELDEWNEQVPIVGGYMDGYAVKGYSKEEANGFCDWIRTLPYSELITGEFEED